MSIINIEHDDVLLLLENIDRCAFNINISNIEVKIYKKYDNIYILSFDFDYDNYGNTIKDFIDYIKSDKNIKINKIKKYKFYYRIKLSKILSIEDLYSKDTEIKMIKKINSYKYEILHKNDNNLYYEYKHYNQLNPNISYKFKISYEKENNEYRKIYILLYKKYNLNFKNIIDLKIDLVISDKIKETEEISEIVIYDDINHDRFEIKSINDKQIINIFNHFQYNKFTKDILYNLFLKDKNNKIKYIQKKYENLIYKLKIIHNQLNLINFIL